MSLSVGSRKYQSHWPHRGIITGPCAAVALSAGVGYGNAPAGAAVRSALASYYYWNTADMGSTGDLVLANQIQYWLYGTSTGSVNTHMVMSKTTSPSITGLAGGGYEVAYQASTGYLWVEGADGSGNTGLHMMAGTSPSITGLENGSYEYAYQSTTGSLATGGWDAHGRWSLGMAKGTSPAITWLTGSNTAAYETAFQANTGILWTAGSDGTSDSGQMMCPVTNPGITALPNGSYEDTYSIPIFVEPPGTVHCFVVAGGYEPTGPAGGNNQTADEPTSPAITAAQPSVP